MSGHPPTDAGQTLERTWWVCIVSGVEKFGPTLGVPMGSSARIDVVVKKGGVEIGYRENSPVRKLPEGNAGIVVNGLVYPLYDDLSVDLGDAGTPKKDCPGFFQLGEAIVFARPHESLAYFFEDSRYGTYLAFDGAPEFAERLNAAFEERGLSRGYGESFRPAKNGHFYDFFIRLHSRTSEEDVESVLKSVSQSGEMEQEEGSDSVRLFIEKFLGDLRRELDDSRRSLQQTAIELADEKARSRHLNARIDAQQAVIASLESNLKSALGALAEKDAASQSSSPVELDSLREQLDQQRTAMLELRESLGRKERDNQFLDSECRRMSEEVAELKNRLRDYESEARPLSTVPANERTNKLVKRKVNELITGAFPRLQLDDEDFANLITSYQDIADCARILSCLQENRDILKRKKFHDYPGLFEITHVHTGIPGRGHMGRIYYRKVDGQDKIDVAIHVKGNDQGQKRFVERRFG